MDIPAMRANFAKAAENGDEAPLYFYSHLFLSHPQVRSMFPVSMADQRDRFFMALGDLVGRVDDVDTLIPTLQQLARDHRKFGTLPEHYPAVRGSLLATLAHFDDDWNAELERSWIEAYDLITEVMVKAAEEASDQPPWWNAEVVEHERRTVDTSVMRLRTDPPLDFVPGQAVSVETELRPRLWRYYSLANAPRPDGLVELHVKARDGGPVSSTLARLIEVGDVVRFGSPMGHFALDPESDRDLLLVGGGTGWAPLKALVDQLIRQGPAQRVDVFLGARTEPDFYDRADLERLQKEYPWLTVTLAVSEDDLSPLERGDIGEVMMRHGPWLSREVYIAGPPAMVDDTVSRLREHGMREKRIHTEVFAPSRQGPDVEGKVTE